MKEKLKAISIAIIITSVFIGVSYFLNHVFNYFLKEKIKNQYNIVYFYMCFIIYIRLWILYIYYKLAISYYLIF